MSDPFTLSALVLPVQFEHDIFQLIRDTHTVDGKRGMPPHISILYPFVENIDQFLQIKEELRSIFPQSPFLLEFTSFEMNLEKRLLYLQPSESSLIKKWMDDCAHLMNRTIPEHFVHLTIAKTKHLEQLQSVFDRNKDKIKVLLPLTVEITAVAFYAERIKNWQLIDQLNFSLPSPHGNSVPLCR